MSEETALIERMWSNLDGKFAKVDAKLAELDSDLGKERLRTILGETMRDSAVFRDALKSAVRDVIEGSSLLKEILSAARKQ